MPWGLGLLLSSLRLPFPCQVAPHFPQLQANPTIPVTPSPPSVGVGTVGMEARVTPPQFLGNLFSQVLAADQSRFLSLLWGIK